MNERGGSCFPSYATLCREAGASQSTVQRAVKTLVAGGFLTVEPGTGRRSSVYTATFPAEGGQGDHPAEEKVSERPPRVVTGTTEDVIEDVEGSLRSPSRPPDLIWDALEQILGPVTNDMARGKRNKAVKALRQSGATPVAISYRARRYRQLYPGAALTDLALAAQWDNLAPPKSVFDDLIKETPMIAERDPDAAKRAREVLDRLSGGGAKVEEA